MIAILFCACSSNNTADKQDSPDPAVLLVDFFGPQEVDPKPYSDRPIDLYQGTSFHHLFYDDSESKQFFIYSLFWSDRGLAASFYVYSYDENATVIGPLLLDNLQVKDEDGQAITVVIEANPILAATSHLNNLSETAQSLIRNRSTTIRISNNRLNKQNFTINGVHVMPYNYTGETIGQAYWQEVSQPASDGNLHEQKQQSTIREMHRALMHAWAVQVDSPQYRITHQTLPEWVNQTWSGQE